MALSRDVNSDFDMVGGGIGPPPIGGDPRWKDLHVIRNKSGSDLKIVVTVQSQALSINASAPSLGLVLSTTTNHHQTQTFSLVVGFPAELNLVDIFRTLP